MRAAAPLALLIGLLLAPDAPAQSRVGRLQSARVECAGPLSGLGLSWPDGSGCEVALELAAGELRTLEVPLPDWPAGTPRIEVGGAGRVRWLGWETDWSDELESRWSRLPAGLRLRPRPEPPDGAAQALRVPLASLLVACAAFLAALRLRARPALACSSGGLGALLALTLAGVRPEQGRVLEVLEGDGAAWVLTRLARGRLELAPGERVLLTSTPADVPLQLRAGASAWGVHAPLATLGALVPLGADAFALRREGANALDDFADCWLRGEGGTWAHLGPWPRGAPLPAAGRGAGAASAPPAALVAGLPAGRAVFLGLRERPEHPRSDQAWVRVVGFEP